MALKPMRKMNAHVIQGKDFDAFPHQVATPPTHARGDVVLKILVGVGPGFLLFTNTEARQHRRSLEVNCECDCSCARRHNV